MSDKSIAAARAEADRARERMLAQAHDVQARLKPAAVVEQVRGELKRSAENGAEKVITAAQARPVALGLAAAGVTSLLVLPALFRRARRRKKGRGPGHGDDNGR